MQHREELFQGSGSVFLSFPSCGSWSEVRQRQGLAIVSTLFSEVKNLLAGSSMWMVAHQCLAVVEAAWVVV